MSVNNIFGTPDVELCSYFFSSFQIVLFSLEEYYTEWQDFNHYSRLQTRKYLKTYLMNPGSRLSEAQYIF